MRDDFVESDFSLYIVYLSVTWKIK